MDVTMKARAVVWREHGGGWTHTVVKDADVDVAELIERERWLADEALDFVTGQGVPVFIVPAERRKLVRRLLSEAAR